MALDRLTKITGPGIATDTNWVGNNANYTGIVTATKFVGPIEGAITSADASFTGSVSIGGTLTYEDVTNVDSVGLITARNGINVSGGSVTIAGVTTHNEDVWFKGATSNRDAYWDKSADTLYFKDNARIVLGNSSDFRMYHTPNSGAYGGANILGANGHPIYLMTSMNGAGENGIMINPNSDVKLFYDNAVKLETSAKGIQVGTGVTIETNGNSNFVGVSSLGTGATGAVYLYNPADDDLSGTTNDDYGWKAKTFKDGLQVNTKIYISRSGSNGLQLTYNNATGSYITAHSGFLRLGVPYGGYFNIYSNDVYIKNSSQNETFAHFEKVSNFLSKSHLYSQNQIKLSTEPSGISVVGTTTTTQLAVTGVSTFTGNVNISSELRANGNVRITNAGPKISLIDSNNDDDFEIKNNDGVFTVRDATNSADRLTINSDGQIQVGTSAPIYFKYSGSAAPTNNNNATLLGSNNIGLIGQYSSINMPFDHSTATTSGSWWMLGRVAGTSNEWGLYTRSGGLSNVQSVWKIAGSSNGNIDYQTFSTGANSERMRIVSNGEVGINVTDPEAYGANGHGYAGLTVQAPSGNYSGITIRSNYAGGGGLFFSDGSGSNAERKNLGFASDHVNKRMNFIVEGSTVARFTEHGFHPNPADSALANALNDYEEGTFVPGTSGYTTASKTAQYTKIGNTVHYQIQLATIGGSASFIITNLPFAVNAGWGGTIGITNHGTQDHIYPFPHQGMSSMYVRNSSNVTYGTTNSRIAGKFFYIWGSYITNA